MADPVVLGPNDPLPPGAVEVDPQSLQPIGAPADAAPPDTGETWGSTLSKGFRSIPGATQQSFGGVVDLAAEGLRRQIGATPDVQALQAYGRGQAQAGQAAVQPLQPDASLPKRAVYGALVGAPQLAAGLGIEAATRNPLATAGFFGALGAGDTYEQHRDDPNVMTGVGASAAVNALSALPITHLLGAPAQTLLGGAARSVRDFAAIGALQSAAQKGIDAGVFNEHTTVADVLRSMGEGGLSGGISGLFLSPIHALGARRQAPPGVDPADLLRNPPPFAPPEQGAPPSAAPSAPAAAGPIPPAPPPTRPLVGDFGAGAGAYPESADALRQHFGVEPTPLTPETYRQQLGAPAFDPNHPALAEAIQASLPTGTVGEVPGEHLAATGVPDDAQPPYPGPEGLDVGEAPPENISLGTPHVPLEDTLRGIEVGEPDAVTLRTPPISKLPNGSYLVAGTPEEIKTAFPDLSGGRYDKGKKGRVIPAQIMEPFLKQLGVDHAVNTQGQEDHGQHGKGVRPEEGAGGLLRQPEQRNDQRGGQDTRQAPGPGLGAGSTASDIGSRQTATGERAADSRVGNAETRRNTLEGPAVAAQRDRFVQGPLGAGHQVQSLMLPRGQETQVGGGVVKPVPVDVMNDLGGQQPAPENALHDQPVFKALPTNSVDGNADQTVAGAVPREATHMPAGGGSAHVGSPVSDSQGNIREPRTLLESRMHEAATSPLSEKQPTAAQREKGNYRKGHLRLHGLDISIENPPGSIRRGVDSSGHPWEVRMKNAYGYVRGSKGADKDHIDVFIGPNPGSKNAYVIDQVDPATGRFDEHKIVIGADSQSQAAQIYRDNFSPSWRGGKSIHPMDVDTLKQWLKEKQTGPAAEHPLTQGVSEVQTSVGPRRVIQGKYDVPLLGSSTTDGSVVLDKGFDPVIKPEQVKSAGPEVRRLLVGFDRTEPLVEHEAVEKDAEAKHDYSAAHGKFAEPAEHAVVLRKLGLKAGTPLADKVLKAYEESYADDLKRAAAKKDPQVPPNLYEKPYDHPHNVAQREMLARVQHGEAAGGTDQGGADIAFQRSDEGEEHLPPAGRAPQMQAVVGEIVRRLGGANWPRIHVLENLDQAHPTVRAENAKQVAAGAAGQPRAWWLNGEVYVNADMVKTPTQLVQAVFHEVLGHHGLRNTFGDQLGPALDELARTNAAQVKDRAAKEGLDYNDPRQRRVAAEELITHLAESYPKLPAVRRFTAALRGLLRKVMPNLEFTHDEIVRKFIEPARNWVRSNEEGRATNKEMAPAFARVKKDVAPEEQRAAIRSKYQGTTQWMKAPNGKPTQLAEDHWVTVRTPAFKTFFGDWEKFAGQEGGVWNDGDRSVSKIVDENGEPLLVYHGTTQGGFTAFSPQHQGKVPGAYFFTSDRHTARTYSGTSRDVELPESRANEDDENADHDQRGLYRVFLNIRDPHEEHFEGAHWDGTRTGQYQVRDANDEPVYDKDGTAFFHDRHTAEMVAAEHGDAEVQPADDAHMTTDSVVREGMRYKSDGAIIRAVTDPGSHADHYDPSDVFVAFSPEQIKLADGKGTFDARDPDVRFQRSHLSTSVDKLPTPEEQDDGLRGRAGGYQGQVPGAADARGVPGRGGVRGAAELLADAYRAHAGDDLASLASRVKVPGVGELEFHAYRPAQDAARKYMASAGLPYDPPKTYAKVDPARAKQIADAYAAMPHAPGDPQVAAAYAQMIRETVAQYQAMLGTGLKVEFIDSAKGDPYKATGPRGAIMDVVQNNHLWVFPTNEGFGTSADFDPANNPLLAQTQFQISGRPALANDLFRAVHDYFGHIKDGVGFRADGEENAWRSHSAMYSPLARRAMTSETRGQNSWLNFGPHGDANRTATTDDTKFADQKTGLLPDWVVHDGAGDAPLFQRAQELRDNVRQIEGISRIAKHLTPEERLKLRADTAKTLIDTISKLPGADEMAAVAYAGRAKRGWYEHSARALVHVFGLDAPRFTALLAALSPQTSVENNLVNALHTWKNWVAAGRPTDRAAILKVVGDSVQGNKGEESVLEAWQNNSVRALTALEPHNIVLSGPKVNSFFRNLMGVAHEVTNDAWMANYASVDQKIFAGSLNASGTDPGKGPGYLAMSAQVRAAAARLTKLTGEHWTPAEVQETVWSWAKTLYELGSAKGENRTAKQLLADRVLTDDLINSTPDFRTLFHDQVNRKILSDAGYGPQLAALDAERNGAADAQAGRAEEQAAPFAPGVADQHLRRAAGRLDTLRAQRLAAERAKQAEAGTPVFSREERERDAPEITLPATLQRNAQTLWQGFKPKQIQQVGRGEIRRAWGEADRATEMADAALGNLSRQMDYKLRTPTTKKAMWDAVNQWELGQPITQDPEIASVYGKFAPMADANQRHIQAMRDEGAGYLMNYFPHLYKKPDVTKQQLGLMLQRRPLRASGFLKQRVYMTLKEATSWKVFSDAGIRFFDSEEEARRYAGPNGRVGEPLEPISDNPVDMLMAHLRQQQKYIAMGEARQRLDTKGLLAKDPGTFHGIPGMAKVNDPMFHGYLAPELVARDLNNHLAASLHDHRWWKSFRWGEDRLLSLRLGLSFYHGGMTTLDATFSNFSDALQRALKLDLPGMTKSLFGAVKAAAVVPNVAQGRGIAKAWKGAETDPHTAAILDTLAMGGFKLRSSPTDLSSSVHDLTRAFRQGRMMSADGAKALVGTAMDNVAPLIHEHLVPYQKMAASVLLMKNYLDHFADRLGTQRGDYAGTLSRMSESARQQIGAKVVDSIDERLGHFNLDNLFLPRPIRDILQSLVTSFSWQIGSLRTLAGGVRDLGRLARPEKIVGPLDQQGQISDAAYSRVTPRLAYLLAMNMAGMALNAGVSYALTGKQVEDWKDLFTIRTGRKLPDGSMERLILPTYMRDEIGLRTHPVEMVINKLHPALSSAAHLIENRDYWGNEIVNPDDPTPTQFHQALSYLAKEMLPFTVENVSKLGETKAPGWEYAAGLVGVVKAPSVETRSDFQNYVYDRFQAANRTVKTPEQAAHSQGLAQVLDAYREGDTGPLSKLPPADQKVALRMAHGDINQYRFSKLTLQQKLAAWDKASPAERQQYHLQASIFSGLTSQAGITAMARMEPADRDALRKKLADVAGWRGMPHTAALLRGGEVSAP